MATKPTPPKAPPADATRVMFGMHRAKTTVATPKGKS
jgi:hypothetical protein